MDNVSLKFEEEAIDFIVEKAIEFKLGARGLRSICEAIMTDLMFDIPSDKDIKAVSVSLEFAKSKFDRLKLSQLKAA